MKISPIDRVKELSKHIQRLEEAESLAEEAQPRMLSEIRDLIYSALREMRQLAEKILSSRTTLGVTSPRVPMELLERLFAVLRDRAESRWNKSIQSSGKEARRARQEAEQLARLAHEAAIAIKIAAGSREIWSEGYAREHGLEPWI